MDFTIKAYTNLINSLQRKDYAFQTFEDFIQNPRSKTIILRHDVDLLPFNSLRFALIQNKLGIRGTYYFRAVPESWNKDIITEIAQMGHEIGYHYECLTTTGGNSEKGIKDFKKNLEELRKLAPVKTICMHGSPMSRFDSKDLWKKYSYKEFGINAEPYFDVDFKKVFYLTDTGRRWDGDKVSVRDKVESGFDLRFHSTFEIIECIDKNKLPQQVMFTFHPQRWSDNMISWTKELIFQTLKNQAKKLLIK